MAAGFDSYRWGSGAGEQVQSENCSYFFAAFWKQ